MEWYVGSWWCLRYHAYMERLAKRFYMTGDETLADDTYFAPWYEGRPKETAEGVVGYDKDRPGV